MSKKTYLITGVSGYLGSALEGRLTQRGIGIRGVSRSTQGDVTQPNSWKNWVTGVEAIFHLAAETSLSVTETDPLRNWKNNCEPLLFLKNALSGVKPPPRVVLASTVTVVGYTDSEIPMKEAVFCKPETIYDSHKLLSENYLRVLCRETGASGAVVRFSNVYGPSPSEARGGRGVLNSMVRRALREDELTVYGKGEWIRDYLYIEDALGALEQVTKAEIPAGECEIFNVCSGVGTSVFEATKKVEQIAKGVWDLNPPVRSVPIPELRRIELRNYVGSFQKLFEVTGWRPRVSLEEGLSRYFRFLNSFPPTLPTLSSSD